MRMVKDEAGSVRLCKPAADLPHARPRPVLVHDWIRRSSSPTRLSALAHPVTGVRRTRIGVGLVGMGWSGLEWVG
jgi:hypothetical protein